MATLADLKPTEGSKKRKKREGRGNAGYGGKTAGKGMNGQQARKSAGVRKQFEGGQTPLYRRLPKKQYIPSWNRISYTIVSLDLLNSLEVDKNTEITPEYLLEQKIIKKLANGGLKVLANGKLEKSIKIKAHAFSVSAEKKIQEAGGKIEKIENI